MLIAVEYTAQLKRTAGVGRETIDVPEGTTVRSAIGHIAEQHDEPMGKMLLTSGGDVQPTLLLFLGDRQIAAGEDPVLNDGDTLTIMAPISGG